MASGRFIFVALVTTAFIAGANGCFNPSDACLTHCWHHTQTIADEDDDDVFDGSCTNTNGGATLFPPLPNLPDGDSTGRVCVQSQADHNTIKKVIQHIQDDEVSELSGAEIQIYQDLVDDDDPLGIVLTVRLECIEFLNECSDFIPGGAVDCCEITSAIELCEIYVGAPARTDLLNLDDGGTAQPVLSGTGSRTLGMGEICDYGPELGGTEDPPEQTGDSSSSGSMVGPFGDIDTLVTCVRTDCDVEYELVNNLQKEFGTFYDDGITLTLLKGGGGAELGGLDDGEDSTELADAFGLRDHDVITEVAGITLDSEAAVSDIAIALAAGPSQVTVKVTRAHYNAVSEIVYTIDVENQP